MRIVWMKRQSMWIRYSTWVMTGPNMDNTILMLIS